MTYIISKDDFTISTDKNKIDVDYVHAFLTHSYWSPGITIEKVKKAIEGSMCFSVYDKEQLIGFARVVTDSSSFAYLADVFIDEKYRGKGLGKWLIQSILAHPDLQGLRRIMLATRDAHKLYEQFGFTAIPNPDRYMVYNPTVNKML
jgi:N-acetylglutamate synthase-like GNAT family acetyltransferase